MECIQLVGICVLVFGITLFDTTILKLTVTTVLQADDPQNCKRLIPLQHIVCGIFIKV